MHFHILILDDEEMVCRSLQRVLMEDDRIIHIAHNREQAMKCLQDYPVDLLLLDYKLGDDDGISVLKLIREDFPDVSVVMITAHGSIETAVAAMKLGAYDFIQKKGKPEIVRFNVQRALDTMRLKKEVDDLRDLCRSTRPLSPIIAESEQMKQVLSLTGNYASSDSTILITGETGVGKSILAEYIHHHSSRFNYPMVTLNCSAIPVNLIESELFGYEKGAFTGANQKGKKGLIEQANNGTIFLDEIGELSLETQAKLLHVLEKGDFFQLGAVSPTQVNVRFIAATNTDLLKKIDEGTFRLDLFYRLNVAAIYIPPLRQRKNDILPLSKFFIDNYNRRFSKNVNDISDKAGVLLTIAPWPGNIRELRNIIERAMLLKKNNVLDEKDLSGLISYNPQEDSVNSSNSRIQISINILHYKNLLHEAQKAVIVKCLEMNGFNISKTAKFMGLPRTSLNSAIQRFGIEEN